MLGSIDIRLSLGAISNGSARHPCSFLDVAVGAGGALTILSDPMEEWREVLLKSRSVVPSVMSYMRQHAL